MTTSRAQSSGEELANSLTHGLGVVITLFLGPALVVAATGTGDLWRVAAAAVYATTLLLLYTSSMLYHALRAPRAKAVFQRLDHAAIYLLIAGTYTPFTLITLRGPWGWSLFGIVWGLAILGVVLKGTYGARLPALSTAVYLGMGWLMIVALRPLTMHVAPRGILWLVAGGLFYTGGVVFYVRDQRRRYHHAIWHLFVLAGSMAHFCAILWYALPADKV
ncbi:MAG TPA: hemolysin III family protein [Gemmatimonadaceae bacterium]|nr:hemolysin III family protein [Gemmatimonadaceae bacterium]